MIQDIKRNKLKTGFIVSAFIVVITLILYFIGMYFDFGPYAIIFALVFWNVNDIYNKLELKTKLLKEVEKIWQKIQF